MIPQHFHWIWIGPACPEWARRNMELFQALNPDFASTLHGEEVLLPELQHAYGRIEGDHLYARRSDLLRLSALARWGGWYFDCDFLPIRPMAWLYAAYSGFPRGCFVTHATQYRGRRWIANGVIGAAPESTFLSEAIRRCIVTAETAPALYWGSYGPNLFSDLVQERPAEVHVGLLDDFYRIQKRKHSMAAYRRIAAAGYTRAAMVCELREPLPFAVHMSMQDQVDLEQGARR